MAEARLAESTSKLVTNQKQLVGAASRRQAPQGARVRLRATGRRDPPNTHVANGAVWQGSFIDGHAARAQGWAADRARLGVAG